MTQTPAPPCPDRRPHPTPRAPVGGPKGAATGPGHLGGATSVPPWLLRFLREAARQPSRLAFTLVVTVGVFVALAFLPEEVPRASRPSAAAAPPAEPAPLVQPGPGDRAGYEAVALRAAAEVCPGLPAPVLTAIAEVESGFGQQAHTSSRGAKGPMQFLPATFKAYATDGDGDGTVHLHEPIDAVYTAARYLCANGGGDADRLPGAVWNYNRSRSYVDRVLDTAGVTR
ncbi:MAG TPA: lytic transglycosylase domain-containing protein [Acidimicrobiales bacterium]|nr:lytic transglycosylase domain-containing protein [Acidimicrobiales bacterium]